MQNISRWLFVCLKADKVDRWDVGLIFSLGHLLQLGAHHKGLQMLVDALPAIKHKVSVFTYPTSYHSAQPAVVQQK